MVGPVRSVAGVMSAQAVPLARPQAVRPVTPRGIGRVRAGLAAFGAAVLGAAPHVLHHVGPLAGAALLAGAGGKLLFGAVGFAAAVPMLRRLRRRTGSWRISAGALALMAAMFTFSSVVIGPALTGGTDEDSSAKPTRPVLTQPLPSDHESHH
jgi:hypothetical protein